MFEIFNTSLHDIQPVLIFRFFILITLIVIAVALMIRTAILNISGVKITCRPANGQYKRTPIIVIIVSIQRVSEYGAGNTMIKTLAIKITELILLTCAVVEMYNLYRMYEATGNIYYLQELGIQVAAFATLSIASKLLGNKINKLKEAVTDAINKTGLGGKCFVAGTLVFTTMGLTPIENITSDTMVYSFNPNTLEISEKQVYPPINCTNI